MPSGLLTFDWSTLAHSIGFKRSPRKAITARQKMKVEPTFLKLIRRKVIASLDGTYYVTQSPITNTVQSSIGRSTHPPIMGELQYGSTAADASLCHHHHPTIVNPSGSQWVGQDPLACARRLPAQTQQITRDRVQQSTISEILF